MRNILIINIFLFFLNNCGIGVPDDETSCDNNRVLALVLIGGTERSDLAVMSRLYIGCSSSFKQPGP
jgi:hypothetical protein